MSIEPLGSAQVDQSNPPRELLLGTAGLQRPAWAATYYPEDLPADWRLGYYANDCDCVLLADGDWDPGVLPGLGEALDEVSAGFRCFLQLPAGTRIDDIAGLATLDDSRVALLVDMPDPTFDRLPQWTRQGEGVWQAADGAGRLVCWHVDVFALRELRRRAGLLAGDARVLVLDGPGGSPANIAELRTLLELLGRA